MVSDFPRTLSLLRQEKKISQRKAANDLGVSQALLSHYENSVREPGLSFVVRAADYYGVSADYLLGRTMSRDGASIIGEELDDLSEMRGNVLKGSASAMLSKKMLLNAISLMYELVGKCGNKSLVQEISGYFSTCYYKVFRLLYSIDKKNADGAFATPLSYYSELCDAKIKKHEGKLRQLADNNKREPVGLPDMTMDSLNTDYPMLAPSLFAVLHGVSEKIEKEN